MSKRKKISVRKVKVGDLVVVPHANWATDYVDDIIPFMGGDGPGYLLVFRTMNNSPVPSSDKVEVVVE